MSHKMHDKVDDGVNKFSTTPYSIIQMPANDLPTEGNNLNGCSQGNCHPSTDFELDLHAAVRSGNTATVKEMLQAGN